MPIYGQGTWTATLQGRDLNGDLIADAYFDTDLNITWVLYHPEPGQGQSWVKSLAFAAGWVLLLGGLVVLKIAASRHG
jgi:hypothetical protein